MAAISVTHRAISQIAYYLERNSLSVIAFDFMDGGLTLDIHSQLLSEYRKRQAWQELENEYLAVGGNIFSSDEETWEVSS